MIGNRSSGDAVPGDFTPRKSSRISEPQPCSQGCEPLPPKSAVNSSWEPPDRQRSSVKSNRSEARSSFSTAVLTSLTETASSFALSNWALAASTTLDLSNSDLGPVETASEELKLPTVGDFGLAAMVTDETSFEVSSKSKNSGSWIPISDLTFFGDPFRRYFFFFKSSGKAVTERFLFREDLEGDSSGYLIETGEYTSNSPSNSFIMYSSFSRGKE
mmetsp:Transcript_15042/g.30557  ORF Transcript_15042/g.30557 Transcript_15042/m.30557 type:complete len:216 (+) Transcript_15042:187-834(+)